MPTPMQAYSEAAAKFGGVDPNDEAAVENFFVRSFPALSKQEQEKVLAYLLSREGAPVSTLHRSSKRRTQSLPASLAIFTAQVLRKSYQPVAKLPRKSAV